MRYNVSFIRNDTGEEQKGFHIGGADDRYCGHQHFVRCSYTPLSRVSVEVESGCRSDGNIGVDSGIRYGCESRIVDIFTHGSGGAVVLVELQQYLGFK